MPSDESPLPYARYMEVDRWQLTVRWKSSAHQEYPFPPVGHYSYRLGSEACLSCVLVRDEFDGENADPDDLFASWSLQDVAGAEKSVTFLEEETGTVNGDTLFTRKWQSLEVEDASVELEIRAKDGVYKLSPWISFRQRETSRDSGDPEPTIREDSTSTGFDTNQDDEPHVASESGTSISGSALLVDEVARSIDEAIKAHTGHEVPGRPAAPTEASWILTPIEHHIKDQVQPQLAWNNSQGGLDLSWQVLNNALNSDVTIDVYFARGPAFEHRLGAPVFSYTVPAGTQPGAGGPVHIDGALLANAPQGTTHIIAASSDTMVGPIQDVVITYGPNANQAVVWPQMIDIAKDGQRANGVSRATITSTARTPADQARAMFNNCLNNSVQSQLALYAAPGRAVIQVYVNMTQGLTTAQIRAQAGAIRAAMEAEIIAQGPYNVSHHCVDPNQACVVDVAYGNLGLLFINAVQPRLSRFINEPNNNCYHLELGT